MTDDRPSSPFERRASPAHLAIILCVVVLAFLVCMSSKVLVGFLFVVPGIFLLVGLPWVLMIWARRVMKYARRADSQR